MSNQSGTPCLQRQSQQFHPIQVNSPIRFNQGQGTLSMRSSQISNQNSNFIG